MPYETLLITLVVITGFYLAWNIGASDVANAMGTSVGSGALNLRQAVCIAAVLEFCGAYFFGSHVSETVESGIVDLQLFAFDPMIVVEGMLSALAAAGIWLQIASYFGWPVSTTHTIVGALIGFGYKAGGWDAVQWDNVIYIVSSWIVSPLMGGFIAFLIFNLLRKQIFFTADPLVSAKKLTPFLVFIVVSTLTIVFLNNGLKNLDLELSFFHVVFYCITAGFVGFIVSFILVRRINPKMAMEKSTIVYNPELLISVEKSKKHLEKVFLASTGDVRHHVYSLLEELKGLENTLTHPEQMENINIQYSAVERIFGYLQIMSACLMAFAHGANDVANAIGPLAAAISVIHTGQILAHATTPTWALALGGFGIVVGLATWGWRVIETIGKKITELTPTRGFSAEFAAAVTVMVASRLGLPISTTHTLVGAVLGVGMARGIEALNLATIRDIVISWVITVPAGAGIAILIFHTLQVLF